MVLTGRPPGFPNSASSPGLYLESPLAGYFVFSFFNFFSTRSAESPELFVIKLGTSLSAEYQCGRSD